MSLVAGIKEIRRSLFQLLFPHICAGCGTDVLSINSSLCLRCIESLPETKFETRSDNPVEKKFWGRLPLRSGSAQFYFSKETMVQRLMHEFKYRGNKELGLQLGKFMGIQLQNTQRFNADVLIPLPLFPAKEKKRGFNQARILCEGMASILGIPVLDKIVLRPQFTETQTKKGRIERWKNMEGKFFLSNPGEIENKHVMLVDDVITTGATLESCGNELLKVTGCSLSIVTLCYASH